MHHGIHELVLPVHGLCGYRAVKGSTAKRIAFVLEATLVVYFVGYGSFRHPTLKFDPEFADHQLLLIPVFHGT